MIPLAIPNVAGNEARYLAQCVETNFVSSVGPFVTRFEEMVAAATGARHAVATSAGTTGLHVALVAAGVSRDDLVILPSLTFIASANAISHCGAWPWLFDVDRDTWTLDADLVERALAEEAEWRRNVLIHRRTQRRIAAMLPVYTLGMPADVERLAVIAKRYRLPIVADAAAALGASVRSRPIGQLPVDLSVVSFNGNKTVTAGGGGAVIGNDEELCRLVRHLTTTARCSEEYDHDRVGFNYRMTNLQAAVGCAQLERLDELVSAKRRIAARYDEALGSYPGVSLFPRVKERQGADWLSGIVLRPPAPSVKELRPELRSRGIDARPFWKPMHQQAPYLSCPVTPMPVTDDISERILTLPCSTSLTAADQDFVISAMYELLGHAKSCVR